MVGWLWRLVTGGELPLWILEPGKEGQVPAGLPYWGDKWAIEVEGCWIGVFVHSLPEGPGSKFFAPSMMRKQNPC